MTYEVGERPEIYTLSPFQTRDGTAADPATVTFTITTPAGVETAYVFGVDAEVLRRDTGDYYMYLDLDEAGRWSYEIKGVSATGYNMGADSGWFRVKESYDG